MERDAGGLVDLHRSAGCRHAGHTVVRAHRSAQALKVAAQARPRSAPREIRMPARSAFRDAAAYYATLLHELTHWTAAKPRCDRDLTGRFGSAAYAMEELVAELGAAFLCADLGIAAGPRPDHAQ